MRNAPCCQSRLIGKRAVRPTNGQIFLYNFCFYLEDVKLENSPDVVGELAVDDERLLHPFLHFFLQAFRAARFPSVGVIDIVVGFLVGRGVEVGGVVFLLTRGVFLLLIPTGGALSGFVAPLA